MYTESRIESGDQTAPDPCHTCGPWRPHGMTDFQPITAGLYAR